MVLEMTGVEAKRDISIKDWIVVVPLAATCSAILYDVGYFSVFDVNYFNFFSLTEHIVFALQAALIPIGIALVAMVPAIHWSNADAEKKDRFGEEFRKRRVLTSVLLVALFVISIVVVMAGLSSIGIILIWIAAVISMVMMKTRSTAMFVYVGVVAYLSIRPSDW
jgi:cobalamin synthase